MPVANITRLRQYPPPGDRQPWALLATHYNGPGDSGWTAPCPTCGADAHWTQAFETAEPQVDCERSHP